MKPLPQQMRAKRKRQALLEAALLEFSEKGYEAATSKTISARASVATGTFYQHFSSKMNILTAVTNHRYQALYAHITAFDMSDISGHETAEELKTRLLNVLNLTYEFHAQYPGLHAVVDQRRHMDPDLDATVTQGEAILLARVKDFIWMFKDDNNDDIAFCIFAMIEGVVHRHVFHPTPHSKEHVLNILGDCLGQYLISLRTAEPVGA